MEGVDGSWAAKGGAVRKEMPSVLEPEDGVPIPAPTRNFIDLGWVSWCWDLSCLICRMVMIMVRIEWDEAWQGSVMVRWLWIEHRIFYVFKGWQTVKWQSNRYWLSVSTIAVNLSSCAYKLCAIIPFHRWENWGSGEEAACLGSHPAGEGGSEGLTHTCLPLLGGAQPRAVLPLWDIWQCTGTFWLS